MRFGYDLVGCIKLHIDNANNARGHGTKYVQTSTWVVDVIVRRVQSEYHLTLVSQYSFGQKQIDNRHRRNQQQYLVQELDYGCYQ
ncbi:hypothetical protein BLOT_004997 [Blomia tropicalis]|nr:hypothetical protein BLOT_004997 [Blomia tropicalis]